MRFLLDANLPRLAVSVVADLEHVPDFARDLGLASATDAEIAARARGTSAALLTRDLDFADIRKYPPEDYFGIVVLRLPDDATAKDVARVLESFLRQSWLIERLKGHLAIVEPDRIRFRPALGP